MYQAVSGQLGVVKQMELIANNLANMNTTGYKAERPLFEKYLPPQTGPLLEASLKKDIVAPSTFQTAEYLNVRGAYTDTKQGPITITGNPLDAAISGKGYFVIQTPNGERYTRAGNFKLDATNRLVTQSGNPVSGPGGDITLPPNTKITYASDGGILADGKLASSFRIVNIPQENLVRGPEQTFEIKGGGAPEDLKAPSIQPGALEGSNVNAVRELTDMIMASRLYESFQTAQQAANTMTQESSSHVGMTTG